MSQGFNSNWAPLGGPALQGKTVASAAETNVRQLIASGKSKTALDKAKELHKAEGTAATEALLVDAYAARIHALIQQNMTVEAKALIDLVQERYPKSRAGLEGLSVSAAARSASLDQLVTPLSDPALSPQRRATIERAIQNEVHDLAALAACAALPPEHPLRDAASALHRAFVAVTSGPVDEDSLDLAQVSHRSPLAPWKLLVRAIGCFYRGEDASCREYLAVIKPESTPARLLPAMRAMLDAKTTASTPACAELLSQVATNRASLESALEALDRAFVSEHDGRILKEVRRAVEECRLNAPGQLERLKQHILVRCAMAGVDKKKTAAALGVLPSEDAYFMRLFARGVERSGDLEDLTVACGMWDEFRKLAVRDGWFPPNGAEVSALYLHMAGLLGRLPDDLLAQLQRSIKGKRGNVPGEDLYFLFPTQLYQRACALDPHSEAFSKWLEWARRTPGGGAEPVAKAWHKIRPVDMEPVLFLMEESARRSAFPAALRFLAKAEDIDGVHPSVRRARLRLLIGSALLHIQRKKPHLAEKIVAEIAALPQSQQADRPAIVETLRCLASAAQGDTVRAAAARAEVERLLESKAAAELLIFVAAGTAKWFGLAPLRPLRGLSDAERKELPAALARTVGLINDVKGILLQLPVDYVEEAAKQIWRNGRAFDVDQLRTLAQTGVSFRAGELAYAASAAGLDHGGADATFLLLRAQSLPESQSERRTVCAAAALELAREQRDIQLVDQAVQVVHRFEARGFSVTLEEAAEVVQKEKAARAFPKGNGRGPDYRDLLDANLCPCPNCRRDRGERVEFDETDGFDQILDDLEIPPGMPPAIAKMFLQATAKAVENGESVEAMLDRLIGGGRPGRKHKKGRRR